VSVASEKKRIAKLADNKAYRDAYVTEHVKTSVPLQIRHLREEHTLTQTQLAEKAQTTQTVISRLEDPNYGNLTLNSLLKIAAAFDIGLLVKFVPFSRLLLEFQDLSPKTLSVQSFIEELSRLKELAMERDDKMGGPSIYETLKTRSNMGLVVESTIT
jgi:transcriptional regulator with XRE-family HTH domain